MRNINIGIVVDELIQGGFQKVAIMEAKYLSDLGYNVSLFVLHRSNNIGYEDLIKKYHLKIVFFDDCIPPYLKFNFRIPPFSFFSFFHIFYPFIIDKYMTKTHYDILITHGTYTAFSTISLSKKHKITNICFIHDAISYIITTKYRDRLPTFVIKLLLLIANKLDKFIISHSDFVLSFPKMIDYIKKLYPEYKNYKIIYNGCDKTDDINVDRGNFAIGVTKWDEGKNFELLLKIWQRLEKKIKFKVIGTFSKEKIRKHYEACIQNYSLGEWFEIVGPVSEQELKRFYEQAKILVHPCKEAFGLTILEAASYGCPSIFPKESGVTDLFPDVITKYQPTENNVSSYVKSINSILQFDRINYVNLAKDYHAASQKYTWKQHAKIIAYLISKITLR